MTTIKSGLPKSRKRSVCLFQLLCCYIQLLSIHANKDVIFLKQPSPFNRHRGWISSNDNGDRRIRKNASISKIVDTALRGGGEDTTVDLLTSNTKKETPNNNNNNNNNNNDNDSSNTPYSVVSMLVCNGDNNDDKRSSSSSSSSSSRNHIQPGCLLVSQDDDSLNDKSNTEIPVYVGKWDNNPALWHSVALLSDVVVLVLNDRNMIVNPEWVDALLKGFQQRAMANVNKGRLIVILNNDNTDSDTDATTTTTTTALDARSLKEWKERVLWYDLAPLKLQKFLDRMDICFISSSFTHTLENAILDKNDDDNDVKRLNSLIDMETFPILLERTYQSLGGGGDPNEEEEKKSKPLELLQKYTSETNILLTTATTESDDEYKNNVSDNDKTTVIPITSNTETTATKPTTTTTIDDSSTSTTNEETKDTSDVKFQTTTTTTNDNNNNHNDSPPNLQQQQQHQQQLVQRKPKEVMRIRWGHRFFRNCQRNLRDIYNSRLRPLKTKFKHHRRHFQTKKSTKKKNITATALHTKTTLSFAKRAAKVVRSMNPSTESESSPIRLLRNKWESFRSSIQSTQKKEDTVSSSTTESASLINDDDDQEDPTPIPKMRKAVDYETIQNIVLDPKLYNDDEISELQDLLESVLTKLDELESLQEDYILGDQGSLPMDFAVLANPILEMLSRFKSETIESIGHRVHYLYHQHLQQLREHYGRMYEALLDKCMESKDEGGEGANINPAEMQAMTQSVTDGFRNAAVNSIPELAREGQPYYDMDLEYVSSFAGLMSDMMKASELRQDFQLDDERSEESDGSMSEGTTTNKTHKWYKKVGAQALVLAVNYIQGWLAWQGIQRAAMDRECAFPKFPLF